MDKFSAIKFNGSNYLGFYQASLNYKNIIRIGWTFPKNYYHDETKIHFWLWKFGFTLYDWGKKNKGKRGTNRWMLNICGIQFRIGNGTDRFHVECVDYSIWKNRKRKNEVPF